MIESARQRATSIVNSELSLLFWRIGRRIHTEVLTDERAGYGEQIVPAVAAAHARLRGRLRGEKPVSHGAICGHFPGGANCRDTVATIELVTIGFALAGQRSPAAEILCPNLLR